MNPRLRLTFFAACLLWPLAAAADQTPAKPLRHLSYDVNVGATTNQDLTNYYGHMTSGKGATASHGTISADVVGLGNEKSLYVRVWESSDTRKAPPVSVQVLADGRVAFDPKDAENLNPEEQVLVGLLGRAVVADHDLAEGSQWKVTVGNGDVTTYRVLSLVDDDKVNLSVERVANILGAEPMEVTITGRILYNFKLSAPVNAALNQHMVAKGLSTQTTSDLSFQYRLSEDSLAGAPAAQTSGS
ncbi:MAG: hypothetical protein JO060_05640 [Candidatus Eremiobacteraeota bacterium]|nr:hypothetical protein [Candidatus Eremiobacteraeota bacterium]MBV9647627.1 hypothetical protein [Candidatus Eremiobacteraeota bacterium]